jgi:hypothetical protein
MTRRYGPAGATPAPAEPPTKVQAALTAGHLILTRDPDDGLWGLRWIERSSTPRLSLTPGQTGPLDEAYRHARHLREESGASYVSVTLDDQPEPSPISAITQKSSDPAPIAEMALRSPDPDVLTRWAADRFGVTTWKTLDPTTRIGE